MELQTTKNGIKSTLKSIKNNKLASNGIKTTAKSNGPSKSEHKATNTQ